MSTQVPFIWESPLRWKVHVESNEQFSFVLHSSTFSNLTQMHGSWMYTKISLIDKSLLQTVQLEVLLQRSHSIENNGNPFEDVELHLTSSTRSYSRVPHH